MVTVIGILASIAIPMYDSAKYAVGDRVVKTDLRNAMTALDQHMVRFGGYPAALSGLESMTGFRVSSGVTFTKYEIETEDGILSVHMHAQYNGSPNAWHAHYPAEGTQLERRNPK